MTPAPTQFCIVEQCFQLEGKWVRVLNEKLYSYDGDDVIADIISGELEDVSRIVRVGLAGIPGWGGGSNEVAMFMAERVLERCDKPIPDKLFAWLETHLGVMRLAKYARENESVT